MVLGFSTHFPDMFWVIGFGLSGIEGLGPIGLIGTCRAEGLLEPHVWV